jgi:hypothetical protein
MKLEIKNTSLKIKKTLINNKEFNYFNFKTQIVLLK